MIARILGILIVLSVCGVLITLFAYWLSRRIRRDKLKEKKEENMKGIGKVMVLLAVLFSVSGCGWEQIDPGNRGVTVVWGEVDMKAGSMPEGLYWYNPISTKIYEIDAKIQRWDLKLNTYTKDVQQANITITVNYRPQPDKIHILFKEVGRKWDSIVLPPAVEGELKKVVGQYDAVDLISHRAKATTEIHKAISESLAGRNVIVDRIEMVNIQFLKEFEKSVEDKVIASQKAVEEANRTKQVQEQAKQKIIDAEATAKSMQIRATALQQNAKLVEYEAVQRWDGKLPQYIFGNSVPFINLDKK
jgi:regulator of protease activity HflC (stomatin/prohibitin superfamily)